MLFPLHCNKCFKRRKLENTLEFYVSRCGHILCKSCIKETCPLCTKPFNGVAVNNEMPQGMLDYFDDPIKLLRRFQKVSKFLYDHERSLVSFFSASNDLAEKQALDAQRNYSKIQQSLQRKLDKEHERMQKYKEYIAYHERRFEQARCMEPPITAQPRQRYPSRRGSSDSLAAAADYVSQLTQNIKGNFAAPRTPTISTNDDSSLVTGDGDFEEIKTQRLKPRTPPPLLPSVEHRKSKSSFSFPKYSK